MNFPRILSRSISSLLCVGTLGVMGTAARAATISWDGGGGDSTLGNALNWSGDILPSVSVPDTMVWNGTVAGPLVLLYQDAAFSGVPGNLGVDLSILGAQTSALSIDSGANISSFRINNAAIAAGAGAFTLGDGLGSFAITLGGADGQTHTWTNNSSNTATVNADVVFGLGGAGNHTFALGGSGSWQLNNVLTNGGGTAMTVSKSGTGTLTLTGNSTYTGGLVLNDGTLNINNAGALGNTAGGALTINGGLIDNTSGATLLTTTAKAQNWNGDFTFKGTNNLNFNTGTVTLGGTGTSRTVNLSGGTLTVGNLIGNGYGLNVTGPGTLALSSATVSRITGTLNLGGGRLQISPVAPNNDLFVGGLTGSGTIETGGVSRWLFVQNNSNNAFSGTLQDGGAALGLVKGGTGTLTLTGTNTYTSQTSVAGGTLEFGSSTTPGITQTLSTAGTTGLVFNAGDSTVKSSFNGTGTASLTFGSRVFRNAGGVGNFVTSGGTNGVDNRINLTAAAGFLNQGLFFGGDNYAWMDTTNGFVRALNYNGTEGVTSGTTTTLASATHQEFTGSITAQQSATFTTLKDNGNNALTLAPGATVTVNGILKSGNVAGGATISGGIGIQPASGAELVIRTNGLNDALTIATPILPNGTNAVTTSGAGTLTLAGANTYTGTTTIGSNVIVTGSVIGAGTNIVAGGNLSVPTSGKLTTTGQLNIGIGGGSYGAMTVNGGTVTSGSWLVVGAANDRAVLNQTGGTITVATNRMTIGAGGPGSIGVTNISGGSLIDNAGVFVGENGTGSLNVSGTGLLSLGATGTLQFAGNATSLAGTVNLLGGTIAANSVTKGTGTGIYRFNFNGGTLQATASNGAFFAALANTQAQVNSGGAIFDTNGFDVTVAQPLLAPTGSTLSSIAVTNGGAGYVNTPLVTISGGSGTGAQAVANVLNGVVTGFTITNPGSGYSPTDVLNVNIVGGGATTPAAVGAVTLGTATSGGLVKNGTGTLTLSGGSTYTGNVVINAGTVIGAFTNINNPTASAFGNATVPGRTITVASGATLRLTANDSFGNGLAIPANLPALVVNGTMSTTRYNQIGAITLNGATLSSANTTDSNNYQNFQFLGDVNVIGTAPSFISSSSAANFDANHLSTSTTFNVADVTGNGNSDLIVSAPFRDQSGNYGLAPGALVKAGAGTMELAGTSTYTGSTTVTGGTLLLSGTSSINSSSGIAINGAKLIVASNTPVVPVVTLTNGTVDGAGTINTLNVADLAANTVANGNGVAGAQLSIGALTFDGAGKLQLALNGSLPGMVVGTLITNGSPGAVTVNASNVSWTNGQVYDVLGYSSFAGSLANFTQGTITGLGARQNATLGNSGTAITLTIAGVVPVWTGSQSTSWTTAVLPNPKNWKLQPGGALADYIAGDSVVFDDTAANTTVSISDANVAPTSTSFNNSTKTYTLTAAAGIGISSGSLTKDGTGTLNLGGTNTYSGPTQLNAGTTNVTGTLGNTAVTVAAGATLNLQSAGAISKNSVTVNGTFKQTVSNALTGTALLVLNADTTLNTPNNHTGGTTLSNGVLNIGNAAALGTGLFTIAGGSFDNTSGAALTLANPTRWNGDINFNGTNALTLGGGVTLGNDSATQTINITNNSFTGALLTIGGSIVSGTGGAIGTKTLTFGGNSNIAVTGNFSLGTAAGVVVTNALTGTLTLSGAASTISTLNISNGGTVEIGTGNLTLAGTANSLQASSGGTINATGGGTLTISGANGDFGTAPFTTLNINAKLAGTGAIDFYSVNGNLGTIALNAANTHTGAVNVENTHLVVPATGAINSGNVANSGQVSVGTFNGSIAQLDLNGGTINATRTAVPSVAVGTVGGSTGVLNVSTGTLNSTNELWVGNAAGSYGALNQSGGTVNVGGWLPIARSGSGVMNMSGGTLNVTGQNLTTGSFTGANGTLTGSFGVINISGNSVVNVTNTAVDQGRFIVAEAGFSNVNISGNAAVNIAGARGLNFATNATGNGVANLNGGTVTTPTVTQGAGTGTLNFNGGTLKASAASATFMQGLSAAYINAGGAVIDDGGFAITVAQPLLAPTGSGISTFDVSGGGYIGTPLVQVVGDGTGATAVANIDSSGNITGVTVTNPGVGYTTATANLIGGGGSGFVNAVNLAANQSGGLTKRGLGTLTLSGGNTYTGATIVEQGTLAVTGSISGSTSVNVKTGATLNVAGAAAFSIANGQTLTGGGSVIGNVSLTQGGKLSPGQGVGTLSVGGNLDLSLAASPQASGSFLFELGSVLNSDKVAFLSGALSIGTGVLQIDDFVFTNAGGLTVGTYVLIDGLNPIVGSLASTGLTGTIAPGFTGTLALDQTGTDLVLNVIPEPGSAITLFAGIGSMLGLRRFRRGNASRQ